MARCCITRFVTIFSTMIDTCDILMIVFISNYSSFHFIQFFPGIFETYLETLFDIMGDFASQKGNRMSLESFQSFVSETEIFSAHDSNTSTAGRSNMYRSHHGI